MSFRRTLPVLIGIVVVCGGVSHRLVVLPAAEALQPTTPPTSAEQTGPTGKPTSPGLYAVPDGGVDALVNCLDQLQAFQPGNVEQLIDYREKAPVALRAAAEKILELEKNQRSAAYQKARGVLLQLTAATVERLDAEEQRKLIADVRGYLAGKELAREDFGLAMTVANGLEQAGVDKLATEAYQALGPLFAASRDPRLSALGELLEGSARRLQLVGRAFELSGTKLDGSKFDLSQLKGRVVLVDFWATWCGPCREEVPYVKQAYQRYHDRGFEVVGVSVDRERKPLEVFVEEQRVPWITLHEKDQAGENPAARRYGILGIPTMFLVGRDGKVLSTRARGSELTRLLAEQFGEAPAAEKAGG